MKNWDKLEADRDLILNKHFTGGRNGCRIDKVILHHNGGNLSGEGCYNVWQTREASAHYQVDANGVITQIVWDGDTAWHAGNYQANCTSIGIEHADICTNPWKISDATLDNGAHLTAAVCKYYGLGRPQYGKNVFFHKDFSPTECPASIAGSQRDAYMRRAQEWYDRMTGSKPSSPAKPAAKPSAPSKKSVETVAREVIAGQWGNGADRMNRLKAAGYDPNAVQAKVNELCGVGSAPAPAVNIDAVARDVINGKYGNGTDRMNRLRASGYDPNAVQARVNQMLGAGGTPATKPDVNIDDLARRTIAGEFGNGAERQRRLGSNYAAVQARVNQMLG
ncbi:N-acetylmuramoyl-L-alanine amidase [Bifidobacterium pseudolongum subsp. globosum]|uniref:N-acetylmuramoyl-L-alanine amidase n=1 Tax=Bifidobacterium pseudolongum TaxID=1694 RepID=UPI000C709D39|nr:N-acetylmuramoyl-L-alanine amidase [Bifidobacterium pseudolongum]PKV06342.1 N-acetylmuramoyl-L-alanine amidase [Bifidobacterium pseudolongum subsp. globosum]RYQ56550.1 N-acetylmuramoyl-L-alanine amidase [Bifidobacterium pseudolongum subsp. globosum]RYQ60878.1 N-acetylmuramoyl-L-alanine amidase [Bifidobacterium pseudolongum subsp. globosum]